MGSVRVIIFVDYLREGKTVNDVLCELIAPFNRLNRGRTTPFWCERKCGVINTMHREKSAVLSRRCTVHSQWVKVLSLFARFIPLAFPLTPALCVRETRPNWNDSRLHLVFFEPLQSRCWSRATDNHLTFSLFYNIRMDAQTSHHIEYRCRKRRYDGANCTIGFGMESSSVMRNEKHLINGSPQRDLSNLKISAEGRCASATFRRDWIILTTTSSSRAWHCTTCPPGCCGCLKSVSHFETLEFGTKVKCHGFYVTPGRWKCQILLIP